MPTERAKPSEVTKVTSEKKLKELLKAARSSRADLDEIAAAYGTQVQTAVEKNHLHRKAWKAAVSEDKMEPEKLAEFYDHLEHYRECLGLNERASSAERLPLRDADKNETEADEAEQDRAAGAAGKNGNVRPFAPPTAATSD